MHSAIDKRFLKADEDSLDDATPAPTWKRATDIAICLLVLPFLALMTLFVTILLKIVSPGPVFFRQDRVGYRGRLFKIYKFRSMRVNNDPTYHRDYFRSLVDTNAPMVKLDSRKNASLIPGAWILRASGLDELPQIINVLRGDMSFVGPRPCLPSECELYQAWQMERFDTLPGLTGLWQVSGKNRTTFDQMMKLDIQYSRTKTWMLDMKIILLTLPALLGQIHDVRTGRRTAAVTPYTVPPFAKPESADPFPQAATRQTVDQVT